VIFPEVLGQERARNVLGRVLHSGRLPHAFLFHGPDGVGKGVVARLLVSSLVCTAPGADGAACGACAACSKLGHGNHPDVFMVTRLPKKEKTGDRGGDDEDDDEEPAGGKAGDLRPFIVVDQIRELTHHASYAPREAARRVFLIEPADRMRAESQNALLKTLEEPPGQAVLILVASRPHLLLPTVRSRCFQLGFGAMSPEALAAGLAARGFEPGEARARAALAEGRPGRAIALDLETLVARRARLLGAMTALAASPRAVAEIDAFTEHLVGEGESELLEGLDLAMALLRDAARAASGSRQILHVDVGGEIERLGARLGAQRATALAALVDRLRGDLRLNVNKTLLAETILAAIAGGPVEAFV